MFSLSEKGKCVIIFAETKSIIETQRRFRNMFHKNPPTKNAIKKWYTTFWSTGSLERKKRTVSNENAVNNAIQILEVVQVDNSLSTRKIAGATNIARSTVHTTMKNDLKLRPYKIQMVQEIKQTDFLKRVEFCEIIRTLIGTDINFLDNFIMSDEATFHLNGKVNKHNCRIWASENPRLYQEYVRDSPKVTAWCGVSARKIYGPFFFNNPIVNSLSYVDMLEHFFYPQLRQENILHTVYFQQDGATPHYAFITRDSLNTAFGNKWIGRSGPIPWPPRSPDLTVPDFFLWGYVKDRCYSPLPQSLNQLKMNITNVIENIPQVFLRNCFTRFARNLDKCIEFEGRHFQHIMN